MKGSVISLRHCRHYLMAFAADVAAVHESREPLQLSLQLYHPGARVGRFQLKYVRDRSSNRDVVTKRGFDKPSCDTF